MASEIKSVKGLAIGDPFWHEGVKFIAKKFPSRSTICGTNPKPKSGEPSDIKVSFSEIKRMEPLTAEEVTRICSLLIDELHKPGATIEDFLTFAKDYANLLRFRPDLVTEAAAEVYGLSPEEVKSGSRKKECVFARYMCFYYLSIKEAKLAAIGRYYSKDHASVHTGSKRLMGFIDTGNKQLARDYEKFLENVKEKLKPYENE